MRHFIRVSTIVFLMAAALALSGCKADLSGKVVRAGSGEPIPGATVSIADLTASTDEKGQFTFPGLKRGKIRGEVTVEGYPAKAFEADLSAGNGTAVVKIEDCQLSLKVDERAVEPKPVDDYVVTLDGHETSATAGVIKALPPGAHRLKVEAANHEAHEATIALAPGENSVRALLSLTPLETYRRFINAGKYERDKVEYRYIHPDERELMSLKQWADSDDGTTMKSTTFGDVRMLTSWKSSWTKKSYKGVAEIDRTIEYQVIDAKYSNYGQTLTDNFSQHWVEAGGIWYLVHAKKIR